MYSHNTTTCVGIGAAGAVFLVLFWQMTSVLRGIAGVATSTPQYPQAAAAACHHDEDDDLPVYPLDQSEVSQYHVDPVGGVHLPNGPKGGERWIPVHDLFYDCDPTIMARYTPLSSEVPKSSHYLSQEGEDQYMYRHFFSAANNRPHYFIELGALDGKLFSNSYFFDKQLQWGGVLIEGETVNYLALEQNRGQLSQKVKVAHLAICEEPSRFLQMAGTGPMAAVPDQTASKERITTVPCIPMHRALSMAALPFCDFYSIVRGC